MNQDLIMTTTKEIKLNLGCRDTKIPGFLGMDCDPHPDVNIIGDVAKLDRFEDNTVSAILASHVLEHFSHNETRSVLIEWHRVLIPGGKLYISVPDFARVVEIYKKTGLAKWIRDFVCGGQEYKTAFHHTIFDEASLTDILNSVGFVECQVCNYFSFVPLRHCSTLRSNIDGKPVSLNIEATK